MKIYIAAPLYSEGEKDYNLKVDAFLKSLGYETFLPQRDGGIISEMPDYIDGIRKEDYVFNMDLKEMLSSDVFLFILDGRVPDEGACVALGNCFANKKICIGYKRDSRSLCNGFDNLMIQEALNKICYSEEELKETLKSLEA